VFCGSATSAAGARARAVAGRAARAGTQLDLAASAGSGAAAVQIRRRDWQRVEPLPTVAHQKVAGRGYLPGSPLRPEQERRWVQFDKEAAQDREVGGEPITVRPSLEAGNGTGAKKSGEGAEAHEGGAAQRKEEPEAAEGTKGAEGSEGREGSEVGRAVAVLMISAVVSGSVFFAMTQTAVPHVANATVLVVDRVAAIFLAVLWFSAFDDILQLLVPPHHHWWLLALEIVVVLCSAVMLAWTLRRKSFGLAAFCGVGAHFGAFMGTHFALNVQNNHFVLSPIHSMFGLLVVAVLFCIVCAALFMIKKLVLHVKVGSRSRDDSVNEFMDRFDDLENDFVAMSLAAYWVMTVRFIITQHYPEEGEVEPGEAPPHNDHQRWLLLMFALAMLIIGTIAVHFISQVTINGYVPSRAADIFKAFMVNSWVFAFVFWAEMEFFEDPLLSLHPVVTRIAFASAVSAAAAVCILAFAPGSAKAGARMVLLQSAGLMVGIVWEQAFDAALESCFEPYEGVHWLKGATALGISALVLPIYVIYFKPHSLKAEEDEK